MADENNKSYKKCFLCLRRNEYIGAPKFFATKHLRAAIGNEDLPTRSGRCVETPGRLTYASCLTAASKQKDGRLAVVVAEEVGQVREFLVLRMALETPIALPSLNFFSLHA